MSASTSLTTLEKVKSYIGITSENEDVLLSALIDSVSEAIEHYCGREFALQERTEYHDGGASTSLVLGCRPVESVSSIRLDAEREFPEASELDSSSYVFYPEAAIIESRVIFPEGLRNVRVTYTAGFETVPPAVEQAANMLIAAFYNRGHSGGDGLQSESVGAYTVSYLESDWPPAAKALLFEYREVEV